MNFQKFGRYALGGTILALVAGASLAIDVTSALNLATDPVERGVLVAIVTAVALVKAAGAVQVARLLRARRWSAAAAMAGLLALCIAISASFEVRFYLRTLLDGAEGRLEVVRQRAALKTEIDALDASLKQAGTEVRTPEEIRARIEWMLGTSLAGDPRRRTLGQATRDCQDKSSPHFRSCTEVSSLRVAEARLTAVPRLRSERAAASGRLIALETASGGDALAEAIASVTGWKPESALAVLAALLMVLSQVASPIVATVFFGGASPGQDGSGGGRKRRDEGFNETTNDRTNEAAAPTNIVELKRPGTTTSGASAASSGPTIIGQGRTNNDRASTNHPISASTNDELPLPDDPMTDPDRLWVDDSSLGAFGDERDVAVAEFVREHVNAKRGSSTSAADLHAAWVSLGDPDIAPGLSARCFGKRLATALRSAGITTRRTRSGSRGATAYVGLQLSDVARAAISPDARRGALRLIEAPQTSAPRAASA